MSPFLKKSALAFGACMAMAAAQASTTTTLTFEPGALDSSGAAFAPLLTDQDVLVQNGVRMTVLDMNNSSDDPSGGLSGSLIDGSNVASTCTNGLGLVCPSNDKTMFLAGLNDAAIAFEASNGMDKISLNSFSISFIGAGGQALVSTPAVVEIGGFIGSAYQSMHVNLSASGGVAFTNLNLAGTALATQAFDSIFIFTYACDDSGHCASSGTGANQFALDDLSVTLTAPVPEPAQWALLPAGLAALAGLVARRRRAAQAA